MTTGRVSTSDGSGVEAVGDPAQGAGELGAPTGAGPRPMDVRAALGGAWCTGAERSAIRCRAMGSMSVGASFMVVSWGFAVVGQS